MKLYPPLALVAACAAFQPLEALPFDDWSLFASGGYYYTMDETPIDYAFAAETNPYFAPLVAISGESASIRSSQAPEPGYVFTAPNGSEMLFQPKNFTVGLEKTITLGAGDSLSGYSRIRTSDWPGYADHADVTINGAQVWRQDLSGTARDDSVFEGDWQSWQFTAQAAGAYTIAISVFGDDELDTTGYFRDISLVRAARVPDTHSTLVALSAALALITCIKRHARARLVE